MSMEKGFPKTAMIAIGLAGLVPAAIVVEYVCLVNDAPAWAPSALAAPLADAATRVYYAIGGFLADVCGVFARLRLDLISKATTNVLHRLWQFVPAWAVIQGFADEARTYAYNNFWASTAIVGALLGVVIAYFVNKWCGAYVFYKRCIAYLVEQCAEPCAPTTAAAPTVVADPEPTPPRVGPVTRRRGT